MKSDFRTTRNSRLDVLSASRILLLAITSNVNIGIKCPSSIFSIGFCNTVDMISQGLSLVGQWGAVFDMLRLLVLFELFAAKILW